MLGKAIEQRPYFYNFVEAEFLQSTTKGQWRR